MSDVDRIAEVLDNLNAHGTRYDMTRVPGRVECLHAAGLAKAVAPLLAAARAEAWDEGHMTRWRRGPDDCVCSAWSAGECGCGRYGTGPLLSLANNPYREASTEDES